MPLEDGVRALLLLRRQTELMQRQGTERRRPGRAMVVPIVAHPHGQRSAGHDARCKRRDQQQRREQANGAWCLWFYAHGHFSPSTVSRLLADGCSSEAAQRDSTEL